MRHSLVRIVASVVGLGLACGVAAAQPLVDNLSEPIRAATVLGTTDPDRIWAAQSFISPVAYVLVSIEVPLGNAIDGADAVAELRRGDDAGGPLVAVFSMPVLAAAGLEIVTLLPETTVTLDPDVPYWLVLGTASVGSFEWSYAEGNRFVGSGIIGNYMYSSDLGMTWADYGVDNPYHIRVNVSSACTADFNRDGAVNSQDFFDFLSAFFAGDPAADFNADLAINSQDFFDFLAAFFTVC